MSIISVMTIISHDQLSFNTSEIGFILLVSYISLIPPLSSMKSYLNPARSVCPHDITIISCLVVWNIYFIFFYIYIYIYWECHHPNWRTPFFIGVAKNHQPVSLWKTPMIPSCFNRLNVTSPMNFPGEIAALDGFLVVNSMDWFSRENLNRKPWRFSHRFSHEDHGA